MVRDENRSLQLCDLVNSDVVETKDHVEVSIELPGMEMNDIEVSVSDDMLTVKGEKKVERQEEKKGYYLSERSYGSIYRTIPLPPGVDGDVMETPLGSKWWMLRRLGPRSASGAQTARTRMPIRTSSGGQPWITWKNGWFL